MSPLQKYLYELVIKHFGSPREPSKITRISRAKIIREMDYILTQWALDVCCGNQVKAAKLLTLNRNTLKSNMLRNDIKPRKDSVALFMDSLLVK